MSTRKNPVRFSIDFVNKSIIGTKASLNKAKCYGSDEYTELCELMEAHPRFKVVVKRVNQNKSKQGYKNLSFEFIEKYISIQPDSATVMNEYKEVKHIAASLGISVYPYTKSWFLKRFSVEGKPFNMDKAREEINGLAAAQV